MYDRAETRPAYSRLWTSIRDKLRDAGINAPDALNHGLDPWMDWQARDLLLSQCCSFPYRTEFKDKLHIVGTPDFGLDGCPGGYYRSVIVMRRGQDLPSGERLATARWAVNDQRSQSGWAAAMTQFSGQPSAIDSAEITGSHRASAEAVAKGLADIAALDAQTWRMISKWDSFADNLTVVAQTQPTPGLPLVTAHSDLIAPLYQATSAAISEMPEPDRQTTGIQRLARIPRDIYLKLPLP